MDLHALKFEKASDNWKLLSVDRVTAAEIQPDDARIFVARECDIDWVSAAVEASLNKEGGR
ncbi:hypothetical protein BLJAPNOD_02961 [Ensifer sp. M14]|nr:hypothetical protein [Ensifer sp. M14]RDL51819.1 hypothetical protein BLJAPNOD_02961 [Ensifer sp. M14]